MNLHRCHTHHYTLGCRATDHELYTESALASDRLCFKQRARGHSIRSVGLPTRRRHPSAAPMTTARSVSPGSDNDARSSSPNTLSRSSSRRTLRTVPSSSSDPASAHPLLSDSTSSGSNAPGTYAVYDKSSRKRAGSSSQSLTVLSPPSSTLSPNEGPLAPSPSPSPSPFAPSSTHSLPPLISRPSSTQLPPPAQGRQYARSVSEAKEQLQRQALKAELQDLGLSAESAGAALVARLGTLDDDVDLKSLSVVVRSGKVSDSAVDVTCDCIPFYIR